MENKVNCLAHFLEKSSSSIYVEDESLDLYRHEDKVYKILDRDERLASYRAYLLENLHNLNKGFLSTYIVEDLPDHIVSEEFSEYIFEFIIDQGNNANYLILAHIRDLDSFVADALKSVANDNVGKYLAEKDGKEHYSQSYSYYLYQIE